MWWLVIWAACIRESRAAKHRIAQDPRNAAAVLRTSEVLADGRIAEGSTKPLRMHATSLAGLSVRDALAALGRGHGPPLGHVDELSASHGLRGSEIELRRKNGTGTLKTSSKGEAPPVKTTAAEAGAPAVDSGAESPDLSVDDAEAEATASKPQEAPPATKADVDEKQLIEVKKTAVLPTMKWIDEHLKKLGVDRADMVTAEAKARGTKKQLDFEIAGQLDSSHSINVQYLQSLDYDREMAPVGQKMTVNGKEIDTNAVNDQLGLLDSLEPLKKDGELGRAKPVPKVTPKAEEDPAPIAALPELRKDTYETQSKTMASFIQNYHTKQHNVVTVRGKEHKLMHGDILATDHVVTVGQNGEPVVKPYDWNIWPFGEVPYALHPSVTPCGKSTFQAALYDIEKTSCVKFKEMAYDQGEKVYENKTSKAPMLFVTAESSGCFAGIGYKKVYREHNVLNIGSGCEYAGVIMHLLLHNLGVAHEQARYDRDLFVNIQWDSMVSEEEFKEQREGDLTGEFRVLKGTNSSWEATSEFLEYDYGSLMHFGRCEFSASAQTGVDCLSSMTSIIEGGEKLMGNRQRLTGKDIAVINTMYGCTETCADGVQNQMEVGMDCGGPNCDDCDNKPFSKVSDKCPLASAWNRRMEAGTGPMFALLVMVAAAW